MITILSFFGDRRGKQVWPVFLPDTAPFFNRDLLIVLFSEQCVSFRGPGFDKNGGNWYQTGKNQNCLLPGPIPEQPAFLFSGSLKGVI